MIAEIITIGDELLIGQVIDTNSAWIGKTLNAAGIQIIQINSISDKAEEIISTLDKSLKRSKLILITGGLGPTRDDITKQTLARYFDSPLVVNQEALENVTAIFKRLNRPLLAVNKKQAEVPANCTILLNQNGTAPGMWFEKDGSIIVSMPGVPYEMKGMVENQVLPMLRSRFCLPAIIHHTILTAGIGESFLAEMISAVEDELPEYIKLAYLPALSLVRLRLSGYGADVKTLKAALEEQSGKIRAIISKYIITEEDIPIQAAIVKKLIARKKTLSLAESCTGGYISHLITSLPGASQVLLAGVVSYSNAAKVNFLGVNSETISSHGAVSEEVANEMVRGILLKTGSDYAIAVTGIAGPDGGSEDKPVGTVWISAGDKHSVYARKFIFGNQRAQNIERSANSALAWLNTLIERPEELREKN